MRKYKDRDRSPARRTSLRQRIAAAALMAALTAAAFGLPAAARDTYIIQDGDTRITGVTYSSDPRRILQEAGVTLGSADTYVARREADQVQVTVRRLQTVWVYADGDRYMLATYGEPVSQVLADLGIDLGPDDRVSYPLDAATETGMTIRVTRITSRTVTAQRPIPAQERVFLNTVLRPGQETVLDAGAEGLASVTTKITYADGRAVASETLSETVVTPSRDRVVIRGAETAAMPTDAEGNAILTAGGQVLSYSRVIDGKATAYNCPGYVGHTASGTIAEVGKVAVDPRVIPLGSRLYVVSQDGQYVYGYCIAEDTGGLIKGNKVDLYFSTWDECIQFGYRPVTIYVVD